jgi:4-amino-4-deoxy-L-arabinose transferase-like glycosyltransferase
MSVARHGPTDQERSRIAGFGERLTQAVQRLLAETSEGTIVLAILAGFVPLWMIFWIVSTAPLDAHVDAGEASVWAQHFAFGYKHPPMTAWLFELWFAVFPRERWASDLLIVTSNAVALAISWRLMRDHLDKNRALLGLVALVLVPLYTVKAEVLNANTVTAPFWAATLLFYLRARRGLGLADALLAGAFAGLTMLGKYWAVFLFAGMAVAAVTGPGTRRFWRSPAPYAMAAGAIIFVAPHVWWALGHRESMRFAQSVINQLPYDETLWKSAYYIGGAIAYVVMPLIFLAALKPSAAALGDIAWPADEIRRQALLLLLVPLALPALVNLIIPYRLTPDWTFPNWALLPVVLYGSPYLTIDARTTARAGLVGLGLVLAIVAASPAIGYVRFEGSHDRDRRYARQIAEMAEHIAGQPIKFISGSPDMIAALPFYIPQARPLTGTEKVGVLLIVCASNDAPCRQSAIARARDSAKEGGRTTTVTFARSFLGLSGPPETFSITVLPSPQAGLGPNE